MLRERQKRESMGGTVEYLKEKKEQERIMREGELEVKKKEMEEDEIKMRRRELEIREREQSMREKEQRIRERELEGRLKRDEDLIFVLRQQLQQQQAILEQVQQQNKLLLSLTKIAWKGRNRFTSQNWCCLLYDKIQGLYSLCGKKFPNLLYNLYSFQWLLTNGIKP